MFVREFNIIFIRPVIFLSSSLSLSLMWNSYLYLYLKLYSYLHLYPYQYHYHISYINFPLIFTFYSQLYYSYFISFSTDTNRTSKLLEKVLRNAASAEPNKKLQSTLFLHSQKCEILENEREYFTDCDVLCGVQLDEAKVMLVNPLRVRTTFMIFFDLSSLLLLRLFSYLWVFYILIQKSICYITVVINY